MRKLNYPPPKSGPKFVEKWNLFLHQIVTRDNFHEGHLSQLEILCSLYEDQKKLEDILDMTGFTYESTSSQGCMTKAYPEVGQLNVIRGQIALYTRMLGLMLVKTLTPVGHNVKAETWE
jgi:hypothetical protein